MGKQPHEISPKQAINKLFESNQTSSTINKDLNEIIEISKNRWIAIQQYPVYNPGNNPLMLLEAEKKILPLGCVYNHVDPLNDNKVVYIGEGPFCRAYEMFLRRDHSHSIWFLEMLDLGYSFDDLVHIKITSLTKRESLNIEKEMLDKFVLINNKKPKFNK